MENGPFEDVFPIELGILHCYVSVPEGTVQQKSRTYDSTYVRPRYFFQRKGEGD